MITVFMLLTVAVLCFWIAKNNYMDKPIRELGSVRKQIKNGTKLKDITVGTGLCVVLYIVAAVVCWPLALIVFIIRDLRKVLNYLAKGGSNEPKKESKA